MISTKDQRPIWKSISWIPQLGIVGYSEKDTNMVVTFRHPKVCCWLSPSRFASIFAITYRVSSWKNHQERFWWLPQFSGEGKTFTSLNLLLLWLWVQKKNSRCRWGLQDLNCIVTLEKSDRLGFLPILSAGGRPGIKIIFKGTEHENHGLCLGSDPSKPAELLKRPRLIEFLAYLETQFDVIVFDTPPMGWWSRRIDLMRLFDINLYCGSSEYTVKRSTW